MLSAEQICKGCNTSRTTEIIIECIAPERIFNKDGFFLIILSNKSQRPLSDYKWVIENNVEGIKDCYALLFTNELEKQLEAGNLFYSSFCATDCIVYDACQSTFPLTLSKRIEKVIENSCFEFYSGYNRTQAFFQGANFYLKNSNYSFSLFMLHQTMEQGLRTIISAITNQDVRTHSIVELKPHLKKCAPNLQGFFSEIDERLITLIEGSYSGCRYINNYRVENADVEFLFGIVNRFLAELKETFEKMLETFIPKQLSSNSGL
jgi:uncharacterized protein